MTLFKKTCFSIIIVPLLIMSGTTIGMELATRPTIKANVYFNPHKPAFYATDEHIKYLNNKGIPTPANPVLREVLKAEVLENDGSITDWTKQPTKAVKNYETALTKKKHLSFGKNIAQGLEIENKTFPRFLPVESSFNCTNGSKISWTIEKFPTETLCSSKSSFHIEQNNCMVAFFNNPGSNASQADLRKYVEAGLLNKKIVPITLMFQNPFTNQHDIAVAERAEYSHGKNGSPNITAFIQRMAREKIDKKTSVHRYVFNRQMNGR